MHKAPLNPHQNWKNADPGRSGALKTLQPIDFWKK